MTTRSAGRATATPRKGRTGGRTGRGCGRTRGRSGDQGRCIVYTRYIEKMDSVQDMSGCKDNQKRGNEGESSKDRNGRDDNKRTRIGNAFAITTNPVMRENTGKGMALRIVNPVNARNPTAARGACFKCVGTDHFKATCPRLNQAQRIRGGRPNQALAIDAVRVVGTMVTQHVEGIYVGSIGGSSGPEHYNGDFPEVLSDDLSGLQPIQEIEFRIELVPGAIPVAKSHIDWHLLKWRSCREEKLYAKFSKCKFWLREVQFLGHVINRDGIHVDPGKIEVVMNWETPRTSSEGEEQEMAFQILKNKLCNARVLALSDGPKDFVVYCDASGLRLGCALIKKIELFSDYDCEIHYHSVKANVVADALGRKWRVKSKRQREFERVIEREFKRVI
nr:hypothetical protein [Tanacetum cinerariifolium]